MHMDETLLVSYLKKDNSAIRLTVEDVQDFRVLSKPNIYEVNGRKYYMDGGCTTYRKECFRTTVLVF